MGEAMIGRSSATAAARVLAAAILFSTGGAAIKTVMLSGLQVASIRSGIAAAALLFWLRGRVARSPKVVAVGLIYSATLVLFVMSTKLTTAANAIFLQSAAPLYIAVLAPLLLDERFRARDLVLLGAAGAGLVLCVSGGSPTTTTAPDPATGNLLGVLCSLSWALTLLGLRWVELNQRGSSMSAVVMGNVMAFLIGVPLLIPTPTVSAIDVAGLLYLGIVQIALAYVLLTGAVGRLPTLHVSLLLLIEPVLNPLWTWIVRGENPGAATLAGGALIITAAGVQITWDSRGSTSSSTS
jgi:drug/metabolite transporter, DME family